MKPRKAGGNAGSPVSVEGGVGGSTSSEVRSPLDDIAMPGIIAHRLSDFGGGVTNGASSSTVVNGSATSPSSASSAPIPPRSLGGGGGGGGKGASYLSNGALPSP